MANYREATILMLRRWLSYALPMRALAMPPRARDNAMMLLLLLIAALLILMPLYAMLFFFFHAAIFRRCLSPPLSLFRRHYALMLFTPLPD